MALVMGITIPAGLEPAFNRTLKRYDISIFCNVGKNPQFFPRSKKVALRAATYLFDIGAAWGLLSEEVKGNWGTAAAIIGQIGYNLYVQDKAHRIKNSLAGDATPSIYHQYLVGHLNVQNPATSALIAQYNSHVVYFPATFGISYKTDLSADGANPSAKLKFTYVRYLDGQNIETVETITIPLSAGWATADQAITEEDGAKGQWRVELELTDVTGDIWFDNVLVEYDGEIKINDPYCLDVVKWWQGVSLPAGVTFETIYPTGGAL